MLCYGDIPLEFQISISGSSIETGGSAQTRGITKAGYVGHVSADRHLGQVMQKALVSIALKPLPMATGTVKMDTSA